jgi:hypothetical protein
MLEQSALVILDQHEPPHGHVPGAVHDRRDLVRVASAQATQFASGPAGLLFGHEG